MAYIRIVTDGKEFAVKKGWLFPRFLNSDTSSNWHSSKYEVESYCWGSLVDAMYGLKKIHIRPIRKHWEYKEKK